MPVRRSAEPKRLEGNQPKLKRREETRCAASHCTRFATPGARSNLQEFHAAGERGVPYGFHFAALLRPYSFALEKADDLLPSAGPLCRSNAIPQIAICY